MDDVGQPATLASALVEYSDRVFGYLRALGAEPHQAEEVMQDLAVDAAASAARPDKPLAWLLTVARRRFIDLLRRKRVRHQRELPISELAEALELALGEDGNEDGREAELAAMRVCLDHLAPRARQVVDLRYWRGLAPPDIADHLGWSEAAVRVALSKARRAVGACVKRTLRCGKDGHGG